MVHIGLITSQHAQLNTSQVMSLNESESLSFGNSAHFSETGLGTDDGSTKTKKKPKYKSSNYSGRSCFQQWRWLCHAAKASLRSVITTNLMACNNYFWVFSFLMKANIWACHWFNCFLFLTRQQYMNGVIFTVFHQDICCVYFVF